MSNDKIEEFVQYVKYDNYDDCMKFFDNPDNARLLSEIISFKTDSGTVVRGTPLAIAADFGRESTAYAIVESIQKFGVEISNVGLDDAITRAKNLLTQLENNQADSDHQPFNYKFKDKYYGEQHDDIYGTSEEVKRLIDYLDSLESKPKPPTLGM